MKMSMFKFGASYVFDLLPKKDVRLMVGYSSPESLVPSEINK